MAANSSQSAQVEVAPDPDDDDLDDLDGNLDHIHVFNYTAIFRRFC